MRLFPKRTAENPSALWQLHLTQRQRAEILKWVLYGVLTLGVIVAQDVLFSRVKLLGGTVCLPAAVIVLIGLAEGPNAGAVYAVLAGTFWALAGATMGSAGIVLLTLAVLLVGAARLAYFRRGFASLTLCCGLGLAIYTFGIFYMGIFMGYTTIDRCGSFFGSLAGSLAGCPVLYPVVRAIARKGGSQWTES